MVRIIIVAGGEGTRMGPITETIPKCLVDIYGKPLIQHQLEFFRKKGYEDIIFCVAHFADKVRGYFGDGEKFGLNIDYVQETRELAGTAGSVKLAEGLIADDEDFIVYYGDNLTTMDVNKFIKFHKEKDSIATICIRPLPEGYKSSSIIIPDENNRIKVFLEKPPIEEIGKYKDMKRYINSGIYAFKKKVFELIPKNQKYDFAKQLFPLIIEKNLGIYGYVTTEFFREIGRVGKYEKFLKEFKGKKNILV
jgi:NDP-sugar pyrophosphorylase family protein